MIIKYINRSVTIFLAFVTLIILGIIYTLQLSEVQTFIAQKSIPYLSKILKTKVSVSKIQVNIFEDITLENFFIADKNEDTLLFVKYLNVDINALSFFENWYNNPFHSLPFNPNLKIERITLNEPFFRLYKAPNDTLFNIDYILNGLKSSNPKATPTHNSNTTTTQILDFKFKIKELILNKSHFILNDQRKNAQLNIHLEKLNAVIDTLNFGEKHLNFKRIDLLKPNISFVNGANKLPKKPTNFEEVVPINPLGIAINTEKLNIEQGFFALQQTHKDTKIVPNIFNEKNIAIKNIFLAANAVKYGIEKTFLNITEFSAEERSGFAVKNLKSNAFINSKTVELTNLQITTPNSYLEGAFAFKFFTLYDFEELIERVKLQARFTSNSFLTLADIAYFGKGMRKNDFIKHNLNQKIYVEGEVKNRINKLNINDLKIKINNTYAQLNGSISGLPQLETTYIHLRETNLKTNIAEIKKLIPSLKLPPILEKFGTVSVENGRFDGLSKDFVAEATFKTALGTLKTDINMKIQNKIPAYSGQVSVASFDIGKLISNPQVPIGKITFNANIQGKGFNINDLYTKIDANVQSLAYNNYNYSNIKIDGTIAKKLFKGTLALHDQNADFDFKGTVDLNDPKQPAFDFTANANNLNLQALNLIPKEKMKDALIISGKTNLNFKGQNIDDIEGTAAFYGLKVIKDKKTIVIDSLSAESFKVKNNANTTAHRYIKIKSSILDANMQGDFNFKDLPNAVQSYLKHYIPSRFKNFVGSTTVKEIDFDITVKKNITDIIQQFAPQITKLPAAYAKGKFNPISKEMNLNVEAPFLLIDQKVALHTICLNASSTAKELEFTTDVSQLIINEKDTLTQPTINGTIFNDSIRFYSQMAHTASKSKANVNGLLLTNLDTLKLNFSSIDLVVSNQKWEAQSGVFSYKAPDFLSIDNILLSQGKRKIAVSLSKNKDLETHALLQIDSVLIDDFKYLSFINNLGMGGTVSATVTIADLLKRHANPEKHLAINVSPLKIENFTFFKEKFGHTEGKVYKAGNNNKLVLEATANNDLYKLDAAGNIDLTQKNETINLEIRMYKGQLKFIEQFLGSFVQNTEGEMNGNIKIQGTLNQPSINGKAHVTQGNTTVGFLQTKYSLTNQHIYFEDGNIVFKQFFINDKDNNLAVVNGNVNISNFKNIRMDLNAKTDAFLFLNTSPSPQASFYGKVFAKGDVSFKGSVKALQMNVKGKTLPQTELNIPIGNTTAEQQNNGVYVFVNKKTMKDKKNTKNTTTPLYSNDSKLFMNFDFETTPDAQIRIIMDEKTGDVITAKGAGNMQMKVNMANNTYDFGIYGQYKLTEGNYLFTLQDLVNKKFTVAPNGTINFTGDPYKAILNLDAVYEVKTACKNLFTDQELQSFSNTDIQQLKSQSKINLGIHISEELQAPKIEFFIRPNNDKLSTNLKETIENKLNELAKNNVNELNKQVFGLIVLNQFLPPEKLNIDIQSGVQTTVNELLSTYLSNYLNQSFGKLIDADINLNFQNYESTGATNNANNRTEVGLNINKELNKRISLNLGGSVDVGGGNNLNSQNSTGITGDFEVEYKITEDGKYRAKAFYKPEQDAFLGANNKTGASFSFTHEFKNFRTIFEKHKKDTSALNKQKGKHTTPKPYTPKPNTPTTPTQPATIPPTLSPSLKKD